MPITRVLTQEELQKVAAAGGNPADYAGKPMIVYTPEEQQAMQQRGSSPSGAGSAAIRAAGASVLPTIAGGFATGAGMGALEGAGAGPVGSLVGGLIAGAAGGYAAYKAQQAIMPEAWQAKLAEDAKLHPYATTAGSLATLPLGGFSPSIANTGNAIRGFGDLAARQGANPAYRQAAINAVAGAGLGGIQEVALEGIQGQDLDAGAIAKQAAIGAVFNKVNRFGERYGFKPTPESPALISDWANTVKANQELYTRSRGQGAAVAPTTDKSAKGLISQMWQQQGMQGQTVERTFHNAVEPSGIIGERKGNPEYNKTIVSPVRSAADAAADMEQRWLEVATPEEKDALRFAKQQLLQNQGKAGAEESVQASQQIIDRLYDTWSKRATEPTVNVPASKGQLNALQGKIKSNQVNAPKVEEYPLSMRLDDQPAEKPQRTVEDEEDLRYRQLEGTGDRYSKADEGLENRPAVEALQGAVEALREAGIEHGIDPTTAKDTLAYLQEKHGTKGAVDLELPEKGVWSPNEGVKLGAAATQDTPWHEYLHDVWSKMSDNIRGIYASKVLPKVQAYNEQVAAWNAKNPEAQMRTIDAAEYFAMQGGLKTIQRLAANDKTWAGWWNDLKSRIKTATGSGSDADIERAAVQMVIHGGIETPSLRGVASDKKSEKGEAINSKQDLERELFSTKFTPEQRKQIFSDQEKAVQVLQKLRAKVGEISTKKLNELTSEDRQLLSDHDNAYDYWSQLQNSVEKEHQKYIDIANGKFQRSNEGETLHNAGAEKEYWQKIKPQLEQPKRVTQEEGSKLFEKMLEDIKSGQYSKANEGLQSKWTDDQLLGNPPEFKNKLEEREFYDARNRLKKNLARRTNKPVGGRKEGTVVGEYQPVDTEALATIEQQNLAAKSANKAGEEQQVTPSLLDKTEQFTRAKAARRGFSPDEIEDAVSASKEELLKTGIKKGADEEANANLAADRVIKRIQRSREKQVKTTSIDKPTDEGGSNTLHEKLGDINAPSVEIEPKTLTPEDNIDTAESSSESGDTGVMSVATLQAAIERSIGILKGKNHPRRLGAERAVEYLKTLRPTDEVDPADVLERYGLIEPGQSYSKEGEGLGNWEKASNAIGFKTKIKDPTPGTMQSISKYGHKIDQQRCIEAVLSGRKPVYAFWHDRVPDELNNNKFSVYKAPENNWTGNYFVVKKGNDDIAIKFAQALQAGDFGEVTKLLGYTKEEVQEFIDRSNKLNKYKSDGGKYSQELYDLNEPYTDYATYPKSFSSQLLDKGVRQNFSGKIGEPSKGDVLMSKAMDIDLESKNKSLNSTPSEGLERSQVNFMLMKPELDVARDNSGPEGKQVADALQDFFPLKAKLRADFSERTLAQASKMSKDDVTKVHNTLIRESHDNKSYRDQLLNAAQRSLYDAARADLLAKQEYAKANGMLVKDAGRMREAEINPYYYPGIIRQEVMQQIAEKGPQFSAIKKKFEDYWKTKGYTAEEIADRWKGMIKMSSPSESNRTRFAGARLAEGAGIPPEFAETSLQKTFAKYANRVATDFAWRKQVEQNEEIAKLLEEGGEERLPQFDKIVEKIKGEPYDKDEGLVKSLNRVFTSAMLGPLTNVHIAWSSMFNPMQYMKTSELASAYTNAIKNLSEANKNAFKTGYAQRDLHTFSDVLDKSNGVVNQLNAMASAIGKINGREFTDRFSKSFAQALAEQILPLRIKDAANGDARSAKMLKQLDSKWTPDKTYSKEEQIQLASTLAGFIHGSHDARTLPAVLTGESWVKPFLSLMSWSTAQTNQWMKHVWEPATKGNIEPLLLSTLGAVVGGYAIQQIRHELAGKKSQIPSLTEIANSSRGVEGNIPALAYNFMQMASFTGFAGLGSVAAKDVMDLAFKNMPQGSTFPLDEVTTAAAETIGEAVSAWLQTPTTEAFFNIFPRAMMDLTKETVQTARIASNWTAKFGLNTENENYKYELNQQKGNVRRWKMVEGMPYEAQTAPSSNPYLNLPSKDFKRTGNVGEAIKQVPALMDLARQRANGNPEVYKQQLQSLKQNSYQSMPSYEHEPLQFSRYYNYLVATQGKEAADRIFQSYLRQNVANKAKASLIP